MTDPRWDQLGDILVNYSTGVTPGDKVLITMMEIETLPLVRAVYSQAVQAGGLPQVEFQSAYLDRELMLHGTAAQLDQVPAWQAYGMEWADVYIGLRGAHNPHEFEGIRTEKIAARKKVLGEIARLRTDRTRWVLVRVPNASFAQQAGVNLDRIMALFFNATLRDWDVESRAYQKLQMLFQTAEIVRIRGEGTDLRFSTKGRVYAVEDGHINMPGGEIYTAPVDDSAEGEIFFETPGVYAGQLIHGIRLAFSEERSSMLPPRPMKLCSTSSWIWMRVQEGSGNSVWEPIRALILSPTTSFLMKRFTAQFISH